MSLNVLLPWLLVKLPSLIKDFGRSCFQNNIIYYYRVGLKRCLHVFEVVLKRGLLSVHGQNVRYAIRLQAFLVFRRVLCDSSEG